MADILAGVPGIIERHPGISVTAHIFEHHTRIPRALIRLLPFLLVLLLQRIRTAVKDTLLHSGNLLDRGIQSRGKILPAGHNIRAVFRGSILHGIREFFCGIGILQGAQLADHVLVPQDLPG